LAATFRRRGLLGFTVTAFAVTAPVLPAGAITGGTVDDPANPHYPAVVAVVTGQLKGGSELCSGSLVTTTKVLTAGHCAAEKVGRTIISVQTPAPTPPPTPSGGWISAPPGWVIGDAVVDPSFQLRGPGGPPVSSDVAVVTLDQPITGIPVLPLAPIGYLNELNARPGGVQHEIFASVGYGTFVAKPDEGPQRKEELLDFNRRYAFVTGQTLSADFIRALTNPKSARSDGAVCHGDSGGPLLDGGQIVGVTSWGTGALCQAWSAWQRTDITAIAGFLAGQGIPSS
jgi:hypothetical protein